MGNMCVSSCRCCMLVSVVHPVAILSAVFCVICSLLMFVSEAILYVARIVFFCFTHAIKPCWYADGSRWLLEVRGPP